MPSPDPGDGYVGQIGQVQHRLPLPYTGDGKGQVSEAGCPLLGRTALQDTDRK